MNPLGLVGGILCFVACGAGLGKAQSLTFAGNAQHTGIYNTPAQHLNVVRWTTVIDLTHSAGSSHYGAPLITPANTVIVPVRLTNGTFSVSAFHGATGARKYSLATDYRAPPAHWLLAYQPVIATPPSGLRLYYPGDGGTVYYIDDPDSPLGPATQLCFYTDLASYQTNGMFTNTVFINTPLTADTNGNIFFGFRIQGTAPPPLSTNCSGFVRINPDGNAIYVLAPAAAGDDRTPADSANCAPALSSDGTTLYVVTKGGSGSVCYLLGLDSTTLATKYQTQLRDPRNSRPADIQDMSTASPMVGPDGDVFFGILDNPDDCSLGFLLHFSGDLQTEYPPGGFGWDNTAAIVPREMVPSYTGSSPYLIFSKYNSYCDGLNRIAVLDPHATQIDPHNRGGAHLVEMREVITTLGCTPTGLRGPVTEWCVNTVAVNPPTRSVFASSEDGRIYRWDLSANSLAETVAMGPGVGEPYVPSVIGPDGTVYCLNGGTLSAMGGPTDLALELYSSAPDQTSDVAGQPVTFTAVVTNLNGIEPAPTGSVDFRDVTFNGYTSVTNMLATAIPLSNGLATVTTSGLIAVSNYLGCHFITALYSGDTNFAPTQATLVQKVHQYGTKTTLISYPGSTSNSVVLSTRVASVSAASVIPTGLVSFWDSTNLLAQVPLTTATNTLTLTNLTSDNHAFLACYASDTYFASSGGAMSASPPILNNLASLPDGSFQFGFSNSIGMPFTVFGSFDLSLPFSNWPVLGPAVEVSPGQFQFTDLDATNNAQRMYRVRSP